MIDSNTVRQIVHSSIAERLQIMEIIFQSLKIDLKKAQGNADEFSRPKPFKVRKFSLGEEVHVDREELNSDRV